MSLYESRDYYDSRAAAVNVLTGDGFTITDASAYHPWQSRSGLVGARIVEAGGRGWFIEYATGENRK